MTLAHVRIGRQVSDVEINTESTKQKNTKHKTANSRETNVKCASAVFFIQILNKSGYMSGDSERLFGQGAAKLIMSETTNKRIQIQCTNLDSNTCQTQRPSRKTIINLTINKWIQIVLECVQINLFIYRKVAKKEQSEGSYNYKALTIVYSALGFYSCMMSSS